MASADRLPRRFPVGTRYVVEGVPGDDGELTITSRIVVLPDGRELSLPVKSTRLTARRRAAIATAGKRKIVTRKPRSV